MQGRANFQPKSPNMTTHRTRALPGNENHLQRYIQRVNGVPSLSREEELELVQRHRNDDDDAARTKILNAHLRHVVAIALKYRRYGVAVDELISEGNLGLVHALSKFETDRGTRFVTYAAYWVRAYVLNHIIASWSMVGAGSGPLRSRMFFKLRRERAKVLSLMPDGPEADALLARTLNLPEATVSALVRRLEARDVSLDLPAYADSPTTLLDTIASPGVDQEHLLAGLESQAMLQQALSGALAELDSRERYIVDQRLMAHGDDELSLFEIGKRLGVSKERVRQIETRAKRKLQQSLERRSRAGAGSLQAVIAA